MALTLSDQLNVSTPPRPQPRLCCWLAIHRLAALYAAASIGASNGETLFTGFIMLWTGKSGNVRIPILAAGIRGVGGAAGESGGRKPRGDHIPGGLPLPHHPAAAARTLPGGELPAVPRRTRDGQRPGCLTCFSSLIHELDIIVNVLYHNGLSATPLCLNALAMANVLGSSSLP